MNETDRQTDRHRQTDRQRQADSLNFYTFVYLSEGQRCCNFKQRV